MDTDADIARISVRPRVTPQAIEANIIAEHYFTAWEARLGSIIEGTYQTIGRDAGSDRDLSALKLMTFCVLVLSNGYTVFGVSACASPENFNRDIGKKIARDNAVNQIWPLMGYELKTKLAHEEEMHTGDPLGQALTFLLAHSFGNPTALKPIHAETILSQLIPVNIESNESIAKICHEANRAWAELNDEVPQPRWEELPQGTRDGIISGVAFVRANPDAGDAGQHEAWMEAKLADGWVYGPELDREAKVHPNLVPFDELPHDQRFKDKLFRTLVLASLSPPLARTRNHLTAVK